ncbi:hypothetical protein [Streptomyces sp. MP131-18]|uniref:hypothetical protein n=1 Tax=Streptomyces sp. MP131-18 TaxID=1857892 RepID=UPI00097BF148|nr:hypothetical protein [Streptomyces sp. MP131-18]ONK11150.1 putative ATPase [Streptomyces sp. MP131-18]
MDLTHPAGGADDGSARTVELVAGDFLLTINPVDGSEIESCPPGRRPIVPRRAPADGGGADGAAQAAPLLERDEERHRLYRLLARGRSVHLSGPAGGGRTALLDAVARDCAGLAPDGVIRLSGCRRTTADLMHELYAAVHHTPAHRPGPPELAAALRQIGAVVVLDDVESGGAALEDLLDATPECAFLIAARAGVPLPTGEARLEEVDLAGLSRTASLELLELGIGRPLDEAETDWAADLWFETEGLPLRFVQAAALLRRRTPGTPVPLPNAATLVPTLTRALPQGAKEILRYAVALGGDVPGPARLPALTGFPAAADEHAELVTDGLLTAVGTRHRLAHGIHAELLAAGYGEGSADRLLAVAQHYAWWLGESATTQEAAAETEALLAAVHAAQRAGHDAAVAALARAAAPRLGAALRWSQWERVLRSGQEAARAAGEVAQQAYFHHELGVLAVIQGQLDHARTELEASTALRSVLSDTGGTVVGRRALALVDDLGSGRTTTPPDGVPTAALPLPVPAAGLPPGPPGGTEPATQVIPRQAGSARRGPGPRRNAVAAAAGTALLAVLGTVVAFGLSGGSGESGSEDGERTRPAGLDDEGPSEEETSPSERPTGRSPKDEESPTPSATPSAPTAEDVTPPPVTEEPAPDPTEEDTPSDPGTPGGTPTEDPTPPGDGGGQEGGADEGAAEGPGGGADEGGAVEGGEGGADEGTDEGPGGGTDEGAVEGGDGGADDGTAEGPEGGADQGAAGGGGTPTSTGDPAPTASKAVGGVG